MDNRDAAITAPKKDAPETVRLADYTPPPFLIDTVDLYFSLDPKQTIVTSRLAVRRGDGVPSDAPLVLNGVDLDLRAVRVDGEKFPTDCIVADENSLTLKGLPETFTLEIETACAPEANTALSGLYLSNGMFCTQCEAEGFRRITYFLDRPDVLSKYTVAIEADREAYPVLLANGNPVGAEDAPNGRHVKRWEDPHPKPSYLFALVGGDLACVEDAFTTASGRAVAIRIYVQHQNKDKCGYTIDSLKRAMRWDEETFGREYDLDIFMIVAVDHFNFGAMENKGLNIFNSAYVLASPQTATDQDYEIIESIVAHEYFHNWSGNRVTCRDWFQLCLKEGFTVFRDQEFSADMRSRPVQRIKDVRRLWSGQFPEDDGPLAHPPRPDRYITIDNFYTATVYDKGAELARMLKNLLGEEAFRAGSDLYFDRHDGTAATVEDFVKAMEDASGRDLTQFRRWYESAGRPRIAVTHEPDGAIFLTQKTPPTAGEAEKAARHIPIKWAAYGADSGALIDEGLIELTETAQPLTLKQQGERPVLSFLQGFSAPVTLDYEQSVADRLTLMAHDRDRFNQWSVTFNLWRDLSLARGGVIEIEALDDTIAQFAEALGAALSGGDDNADPALAAELLRGPTASDLAQYCDVIDPDQIVDGRAAVRAAVAGALSGPLHDAYHRMASDAPYSPAADQAGPRALKNACLALLVAGGDSEIAERQAREARNMTDEAAATAALALSDGAAREEALENFYQKWRTDPLVVNKWLAWRALSPAPDALEDIRALLRHEAYDSTNPNKVRALIGVFGRENLKSFHSADGAGYRFFAEQILLIDEKNPQLAARLITLVENWRKLEPARQALAKQALEDIAAAKPLSSNVYEMATRLLKN